MLYPLELAQSISSFTQNLFSSVESLQDIADQLYPPHQKAHGLQRVLASFSSIRLSRVPKIRRPSKGQISRDPRAKTAYYKFWYSRRGSEGADNPVSRRKSLPDTAKSPASRGAVPANGPSSFTSEFWTLTSRELVRFYAIDDCYDLWPWSAGSGLSGGSWLEEAEDGINRRRRGRK